MKFARLMHSHSVWASFFTAAVVLAPAARAIGADAVVFQKPNRGKTATTTTTSDVQFRSSASAAAAAAPAATPAQPAARIASTVEATPAAGNPLRSTTPSSIVATSATEPATAPAPQAPAPRVAARPISAAPKPAPVQTTARAESIPSFAQPGQDLSGTGHAPKRSRAIREASVEPWVDEPTLGPVQQASFGSYCDCGEPTCGICEPGCGIVEPGCDFVESTCGCAEPGCTMCESSCGIVEPGCGLVEPDCGIADCGSCVGNPGPDFWCFPVCLPRFKDLRAWAGVHGFKGPRDSPLNGGAGDGNFGFQEGINIGGRAPLISLLFPQLAYQLGFQAVQSQLSGLSNGDINDRNQEFITAGIFRRVRSGVQFGVAWDYMQDDFLADADFSQLRYEGSLKGQSGLEFGFWGASSMTDSTVNGIAYETVDQYCGFVRWQFREGGAARFWGGATGDGEGLFGAEFIAPLNNRWSVNSGFNYLITDAANGEIGAREESWNVGINLVWHYGLIAKKGNVNPFAPLFSMADNGWMFVDRVQ
jgi:hypothetical protein